VVAASVFKGKPQTLSCMNHEAAYCFGIAQDRVVGLKLHLQLFLLDGVLGKTRAAGFLALCFAVPGEVQGLDSIDVAKVEPQLLWISAPVFKKGLHNSLGHALAVR